MKRKGKRKEKDLLHILQDQEAEIDITKEDQEDQDLDQDLNSFKYFGLFLKK